MNSNRQINAIPAVCDRCDHTFPSPISLDGSRNYAVIGLGTICPRCGGTAQILDSVTDAQGRLFIRGVFDHIQNFKDTKKLEEIKHSLEAANDDISPAELASALVEIEPSFEKFTNFIRSIPASISIPALLTIIGLVLAYQTFEVSRKTLELSREQFEYQKQQDVHNQEEQRQSEKEREDIKRQIEDLKLKFERELRAVEKGTTGANPNANSREKSKLKGNCRNMPCPCGSGVKAKKCHPNGYL